MLQAHANACSAQIPTVCPLATKILSRCVCPLPRVTCVTALPEGSVLKAATTSFCLREKHCSTPLVSPTATFCCLLCPCGSTCRQKHDKECSIGVQTLALKVHYGMPL